MTVERIKEIQEWETPFPEEIKKAKIEENEYWYKQFNYMQVAINPYMLNIFKERIKELNNESNLSTLEEHLRKVSRVDAEVMQKTAEWVSVLDRLPEEGKPVIIETKYGKHDICYLRVEEMMILVWVNAMRPQHTNGDVIKWKEIE